MRLARGERIVPGRRGAAAKRTGRRPVAKQVRQGYRTDGQSSTAQEMAASRLSERVDRVGALAVREHDKNHQ